MAKLHNYYVLCPLIDQKSFLGVSADKDDEFVIVTLGRNVVNKYRLSDQKQIGGWTSKDHITAAVIYDGEQDAYVGVFNKNIIKMWKGDSDNLDKIKKYKFSLNILGLVPRGKQAPLIIFPNGNCASLPYAIENRKTYESKSLIKDNEGIVEYGCYKENITDHICYIVKCNDRHEIVYCPIRHELGDLDKSKLTRVKATRPEDVYIVGRLLNMAENSAVYLIWSDAKMTSYDLLKKTWRTIGTIPCISTLSSVSMAWMGKNHIILFGSNSDQDGAVIIVYNIILGVGSCKYPMKLYSEGAKLYCMHERIILEASNHIGMLPYVLETKRNLSKLLGSHEVIQDEQMEIADWGGSSAPQFGENNTDLQKLLKMGLTERNIFSQIMPSLIEQTSLRHLINTIKIFKDIPETSLVILLNYAVKLINPGEVDIGNIEEFASFLTTVDYLKLKFLNIIFATQFSDSLLIPYLRGGLSLNDTLFLISYITYMFIAPDKLNVEFESKLCDWCILLVDAFYQQFLITKDDKVTLVLNNTSEIVRILTNQIYAIDDLLPVLHKFVSGNVTEENEEASLYSIEIMEI